MCQNVGSWDRGHAGPIEEVGGLLTTPPKLVILTFGDMGNTSGTMRLMSVCPYEVGAESKAGRWRDNKRRW
jgi:hypothetical protein